MFEKGFTLLETVVGLTLVFLLLFICIIVYGNVKTLDVKSENKITEVNMITDNIELIKSADNVETIENIEWGTDDRCITFIEEDEVNMDGYLTDMNKVIITCGDDLDLEVYNNNF